MQRLIRGYEGIPTEVPWCVLRPPTAYNWARMPTAGETYRAHTGRTLNTICHNQEELVRRGCYHALAEVQNEENMCPRYVWHRRRRLATREEGAHVARPKGSLAGGGAHVGDQQDVRRA